MAPSILVSLPGGGTRVVAPEAGQRATVAWLSQRIEELEGFPVCAQRLVCGSRALRPEIPLSAEVAFVSLRLRLPGGGVRGLQLRASLEPEVACTASALLVPRCFLSRKGW